MEERSFKKGKYTVKKVKTAVLDMLEDYEDICINKTGLFYDEKYLFEVPDGKSSIEICGDIYMVQRNNKYVALVEVYVTDFVSSINLGDDMTSVRTYFDRVEIPLSKELAERIKEHDWSL